MKIKSLIASFMLIAVNCHAQDINTVQLNIVMTSDVHGSFLPYDFSTQKPARGSLAKVCTYVRKLRTENPDGVILVDNGDILQGQPLNYYYNYVATDKENLAAQCLNFMNYDAATVGNHDIETGHACYDKWVRETRCPILGANVIDQKTGQPYLKPYTIIKRKGVKVAFIGLITNAIPAWLREEIWSGLRFDDMEQTARHWVDYVKHNENPDIIVGLFHSGREGGIIDGDIKENIAEHVARSVPGFDIVMYGHDHLAHNSKIVNDAGHEVLMLDPSNRAQKVAVADIKIKLKGDNSKQVIIDGHIENVETLDDDAVFTDHFKSASEDVMKWSSEKVGEIKNTITSHDAFFGPSAFIDFVHNLQLRITGADISITAPLSLHSTLRKGDITVADMFQLYKYENNLYVMKMSGKEIKGHLEMSYDKWVNTMQTKDDHILLLNDGKSDAHERTRFKHQLFNFDSAAGIDYTVDVTKPYGQKVNILQMSDGRPFDENMTYNVAINSYRGNGGGELITRGAGIPKEELEQRIISCTDKDQRWYLMQEIKRLKVIDPKPNNNWKFVPESWTIPAIERDRQLIFGK